LAFVRFSPVILAQPESPSLPLPLPVLLFVIPEGNLLLSFVCHSERSEESPHLFMLLPVILAQLRISVVALAVACSFVCHSRRESASVFRLSF